MLTRKPLLALSVLAMAALACGFNIDLPKISLGTAAVGPTQTEQIQIPAPDTDPAVLKLQFGAGELMLAPGAANALVEGTATYNVEQLKPVISQSASGATLSTGKLDVKEIPFTPFDPGAKAQNTWDLKLGPQPMDLTIAAGAYHAELDLGGLSITALTVQDGASDVQLDFSEPNRVTMAQLSYTTGASSVSLSTLANANFDRLVFNGGAGSYTFDFTGQLKSDGDVTIKAGLGQVTLIIPDAVPVIFDINGGVTNIEMQGSFQGGGRQFNPSASGPSLTIHVDMGAGNLTVRNP
jgi:hypothetical protein